MVTQAKKPSRSRVASELKRIKEAATLGTKLGIQVHAGHGFDYENVRPVDFSNLEE